MADRNGQSQVPAWELAIAARLELLLGKWKLSVATARLELVLGNCIGIALAMAGRNGQTRVPAWELAIAARLSCCLGIGNGRSQRPDSSCCLGIGNSGQTELLLGKWQRSVETTRLELLLGNCIGNGRQQWADSSCCSARERYFPTILLDGRGRVSVT